jgi:lysyl-tRNA synthetase, class II
MTHPISQINTEYRAKLEEWELSPFRSVEDVIVSPQGAVSIAWRVVLHRSFGKICFATINDGTGRIQVLFSRENCSIVVDGIRHAELGSISSTYKNIKDPEINSGWPDTITAYKFAEKLIDLGDFIGVTGELFYTHKWELTIFASEFTFLTKAIRPLPEKFHGVTDDEDRFRKRYLDMATDDELRAMFYRKARFWEVTRDFMKDRGFLEVETPTIEHTTGGAEARPFATHHNDYDVDVYMRICVGELWQKRLMAGGFPKTFEIGRAYRNEGSSPEHLQEFTNMEFYWAYADYEMGMQLVQELYQEIAMQVYGKPNSKLSDISSTSQESGHEWTISIS